MLARPSAAACHRQDKFGNYDHGYQRPNSARQESGNPYTVVTGSCSYKDSFRLRMTVTYIADGRGFRVVHLSQVNSMIKKLSVIYILVSIYHVFYTEHSRCVCPKLSVAL